MSGHSGREEERRPTATRSSSFKLLGKRGTAGSPAPSWKPNLKVCYYVLVLLLSRPNDILFLLAGRDIRLSSAEEHS